MNKKSYILSPISYFLFLSCVVITSYILSPISVDAVAPTNGLVGYWNFDEGSGTVAGDSAGSNTGTINGATWVEGKVGNAANFDGVDDYVSINGDRIGTGDSTISAWIYPKTSGEGGYGIILYSNYSQYFQFSSSNRVLFTSNNYGNIANSGLNINLNQWNHVLVTRASAGTTNFYINGVLSGSANQNSGTPVAGLSTHVGARPDGVYAFDGSIDEVRIYNRVLSVSEISAIYNDTGISPTPTPTPVPINGSCGATVNTCLAGTFSDITDTSSNYLWQCTGSSGGTTASCSLPIPPITQPDTTPPSVPTNLSATAVSSSQINLSWSASTDNVGVTGYDIYRGGTLFTSVIGTSYSNTGLSPSTQYSYIVRARDAVGNVSSQSSTISATTQASAPPSSGGNRVDLLNSSGGLVNTYTTIQTCVNAMSAGQTCNVYAGTYNENVSVSAGTAGNYKTVTVNGSDIVYVLSFTMNSYTKVNGFRIQNPSSPSSRACVSVAGGAASVYITNNIMYACGSGSMITTSNATGASYVYIQGNTLSYPCTVSGTPGVCYGMSLVGNHFLVENNDLSHFWLGIYHAASYSVFRNNTFHDVNQSDCSDPSCHTDFIFSEPVAPAYSQYTVIENNIGRNSVGSDAKGFLLQADACNGKCYNAIVRFNTVAHTGSTGLLDDNAFNSSVPGFSYVKAYNNTWVNTNNIIHEYSFSSIFANNSTHGSTINSLFYYPRSLISFNPYATDSTTSGTFSSGNNLAYCTTTPCNLKGRVYDRGLFTDDPGNKIANPQFINYASNDFRLQASSPAIDAGGSLTSVASTDSGSGTTLRLNDAAYFQDGYGLSGVQPDWIAIGSPTNIVQISSINYSTNTITLASSISRSPGQAVYLYKDSSGRQVLYGSAPDIGAYEYTGSVTPPTTHTITASAGTGGSISPSGSVSVSSGGSQTFTITSSTGYSVLSIMVDGSNMGAITSYTFSNVTANHTISATFTANQPVPGDFNLDHVVNTLDFSLLNSRWLQNYPPYDLFVDGLINSLDFAIFSSNWGKTW